jgi:Tol biopolymer transport system component
MNLKNGRSKQVTHLPGYDGGAFFSPDSKWLVFRASRPKTDEELKDYKDLLSQGLVAPTQMEIFICRTNGRKLRQVTRLGKANWAPFFHPSGQKIIFSSNHHSQRGYQFNLFMVDLNGENLKQISFDPTFDAFPMFSPDGKKIVFSSNRLNDGTRATNVFIADWID